MDQASCHMIFHIRRSPASIPGARTASSTTSQRSEDFIRTMEIILPDVKISCRQAALLRNSSGNFLQQNIESLRITRSVAALSGLRAEELLHQATAAFREEEWDEAESICANLTQWLPGSSRGPT